MNMIIKSSYCGKSYTPHGMAMIIINSSSIGIKVNMGIIPWSRYSIHIYELSFRYICYYII